MEKNIFILLKSLEQEKEFFEEYKKKFAKSFLEEMLKEKSKKDVKLISSSAIMTIGEKLYLLLFLSKKDALDELYNFAYKVAKNNIDLKEVMIKTTLKLVRDFIDYILEKKRDFNLIKKIISLIDLYLVQIDKAYSKYYQEIEEELNTIKKERIKKDEEIIIALFKNILKENRRVDIIDYYKEVPVVCKSYLKRVENEKIFLDVKECKFNIFKDQKIIFLKIPSFPKAIKAKIVHSEMFEYIEASGLSFDELPQEKREFVRVEPKETIFLEIIKDQENISGIIKDISIGGVGVFVDDTSKLKKEDEVLVRFELKNRQIETKGIIKYVLDDIKRVGIKFLLDNKLESELAEYVLERQFEIIKELRL